ncbi:MAG: hypothetical protein KIT31_34110 [Deltaproteobacteria bacterium]|nr:hypothetical protein [Deltaproteobacteria bacterium]
MKLGALAAAGFDIAHAFDAARAARDFAWLGGAHRLGILVGNTRALWPPFTEALRDPALAAEVDPLDRYAERAIADAFPGARIRFAHATYDGAFLPLQRLAVATGLAALGPHHLLVHPIHGPWFALRAVVTLDGEPPPPCAPIVQPCACDGRCEAAFEAARSTASARAWLAVRDACTIRAARYSDDQIRYHYESAFPGDAPHPAEPDLTGPPDGAGSRSPG